MNTMSVTSQYSQMLKNIDFESLFFTLPIVHALISDEQPTMAASEISRLLFVRA